MFKLKSDTYRKRHENEINRFIVENSKWINIIRNNKANSIETIKDKNIYIADIEADKKNSFDSLGNSYYDLIVLTDIFELSDDVYSLLTILKNKLNQDGKFLLTTVNPKWNALLLFFEKLKLKEQTKPRSYIHHKKINLIAESVGLEQIQLFNRQIFPFKLFGIGTLLNKLLEVVFGRINLGINNYMLFTKKEKLKKTYKKTIIIPAKNEEKNLQPLFERIPKLSGKVEYIFICGPSKDKTLEASHKIKNSNPDLDISVFNQKTKGKGNGVIEAIKRSKGDLITILDSDISVEPETLKEFFEIIENGYADFINGTRFIYKMEEGAMRKLNSLGNIFFQAIISIVISRNLTDSLCGTKVFKKEMIEKLFNWKKMLKVSDPFGDFDLIFTAAYFGYKITEYPVHYKSRVYGSTQISRFRDGVRLLFYFLNSIFVFHTSND